MDPRFCGMDRNKDGENGGVKCSHCSMPCCSECYISCPGWQKKCRCEDPCQTDSGKCKFGYDCANEVGWCKSCFSSEYYARKEGKCKHCWDNEQEDLYAESESSSEEEGYNSDYTQEDIYSPSGTLVSTTVVPRKRHKPNTSSEEDKI